MRRLYLFRHAQPERPEGSRRCISRTDAPLDGVGLEQAAALGRWLAGRPIEAVYTSPSLRCIQTAEALRGVRPLYVREDLRELDVGVWEGLPFEEIRLRWPEQYEARGRHMGTVAPPGGESFLQAGERFGRALAEMLSQGGGDIAIVAHGGLLRGWLCPLLGRNPDKVRDIPQPWGGVTIVREGSGLLTVEALGCKPFRVPGELERQALFARCGTPDPVQAHCRAVAALALRLAESAVQPVDLELLEAACLLHDLCRTDGREHPAKAQALLEREGYPELGAVIARHHDLGQGPAQEMELLYLADKLLLGTQPVTIEERFAAARQKCEDAGAQAAWYRRYEDAKRLEQTWGGIR